MKYAADFRQIARDALKGNWKIAVLAGLVASLLGGINAYGPKIQLDIKETGASVDFQFFRQTVFSTREGFPGEIAFIFILAALLLAAALFVLGSMVQVGHCRLHLELHDRREASMGLLFDYVPHWKTTAVTKLLKSVYIFLWSLLLIVPGIIATYSYAMTDYILAENPELTASEAISNSKEMMEGNRWRLFCLHLSFIGWEILAALTLNIGNLWLRPYIMAAETAFYRDVSGTAGKERHESF